MHLILSSDTLCRSCATIAATRTCLSPRGCRKLRCASRHSPCLALCPPCLACPPTCLPPDQIIRRGTRWLREHLLLLLRSPGSLSASIKPLPNPTTLPRLLTVSFSLLAFNLPKTVFDSFSASATPSTHGPLCLAASTPSHRIPIRLEALIPICLLLACT